MKINNYTTYFVGEMDLREMVADKLSNDYGIDIDTTYLRIQEYSTGAGCPKHYVRIDVDENTGKVLYK